MEKQTRMEKYKQLRDEMKEEAGIQYQSQMKEDEEDDFLSFLPQSHHSNSLDDTLIEPLSYETLDNQSDTVQMALNAAKMNVGKDQYNTRLDILNQIKKEEIPEEDSAITTQRRSQKINDDLQMEDNPHQKKKTLLEKLAEISPKEDVDELNRYTEEENIKNQTEEIFVDDFDEEEDEEDDDGGKIITLLNCVVIGFIIVFIILSMFIFKELLF